MLLLLLVVGAGLLGTGGRSSNHRDFTGSTLAGVQHVAVPCTLPAVSLQVKAIVERLVGVLTTPSESVQRAVSDRLPPLMQVGGRRVRVCVGGGVGVEGVVAGGWAPFAWG